MKQYEVASDNGKNCINFDFDNYQEAYRFIYKMAQQDQSSTWTLYSHKNGVEKELFSLNQK